MRRILLLFLLPLNLMAQDALKSPELANEVKQEFLHAWKGYKTLAWGKDALKPMAKSGYNEYLQSFHLSALETYSTLTMMGLDTEALEVKEHLLQNLKFKQFAYVPVGEFGSRALSSLVAAYQLDGDVRFVELATDLANRLLPAFDTKTGMPRRLVSLASRTTKGDMNSPQEIGSLLVEFGLLSKITGNPTYFNHAKRAAVALWKKRTSEDLLGKKINVTTGEWYNKDVNTTTTISGYFAAMLKAYLLFGDQDCKQIWKTGTKAIEEHLSYQTALGKAYKHSHLERLEKNDSLLQYSEVAYAGYLALGGKLQQAEANYTYFRQAVDTLILPVELKELKKNKLTRAGNKLYPEQLEAIFTLQQANPQQHYFGEAKAIFNFMKENCRKDNGYTALRDVLKKRPYDAMPPHVLAQNFKYLYLIFAKHKWNLNEYVFVSGQPLKSVK